MVVRDMVKGNCKMNTSRASKISYHEALQDTQRNTTNFQNINHNTHWITHNGDSSKG